MHDTRVSVSEFVASVNQTFDYAYPGGLVVVGEVSGFTVRQNKWVRFKLKDESATIDIFGSVYSLKVPLEDGMIVAVAGKPKLSDHWGFSFGFSSVQPVGEGSIKRSFDLLLKKLTLEGLFDESRKRQLPQLPGRIGLISSTQAAGYADFIKIVNDRWGGMDITVANTLVQGVHAPGQITRAINHFNTMSQPPDVIVIVRGGGSADDLAAFNDEGLVRAIAASRIPTLVGVGHEVDTTLSDLAADVRAATPSNAAQLLVPDRRELRADLSSSVRHMLTRMANALQRHNELVHTAEGHMLASMEKQAERVARRARELAFILRQVDPKLPLTRGYALLRNDEGQLIRGSVRPQAGDAIHIETKEIIIDAGVTHIHDK